MRADTFHDFQPACAVGVSTPWQGATRRIGYSPWECRVLIHTVCPDLMSPIFFANGFIPPEAHIAIRLGIRGIVVGDFFTRLVVRTVTQQVSGDVEKATKPFQFALSTRAGCQCVSHVLRTLLEMDEKTSVVSGRCGSF